MNSHRYARLMMLLLLTSGTTAWTPVLAEDAKPTFPPMRLLKTADGTQFGLFSEKPAAPAATLFIFAGSIDEMGSDPARFYTQTGRELAKDGWLYVVIDPRCHGYDKKAGEPVG